MSGGGKAGGSLVLPWGREESRVIFERGYLSSGLGRRQGQVLEEDNGGHLVPFRNRPQLAKVKPIPVL